MSVLPSDLRLYAAYADPAYDGSTTLAGAISSTTATSISVTSAASFPQTGEYLIQIDSEFLLVTQGTGTTTWTVIRGVLGSTAATHSNGATVTTFAGGPVCMYGKIAFSDVVSGHTVDYVSSSSSDTTPQLTVTGLDAGGALATETKTLNGTTVVTGSQAFGRLERVRLAAPTTLSGAITNVATTIAVASSTGLPASGNYYAQIGLEIVQITAGQGTTSLTATRGALGTTATAHNSGDGFSVAPLGDIAVIDHTATVTGTAQTGSANSTGVTPALFKLAAGQGASVSVGQVIRTTGGTGPNQIRTIIATSGYGTDVVAVSRDWSVVPDNTTTYSVNNGFQLDLAPNPILAVQRFLWNAQADAAGGSTRNFYQKAFIVNDNTTTTLTAPSGQSGVQHEIMAFSPALPSGATVLMALATGLNDTVAWATRQTAPGSGYSSFTSQPTALTQTASSGNLPGGAAPNTAGALGVAFQAQLTAGTAAYKGSATYQAQGATT